MSRIGKLPISIPNGVTVTINNDNLVTVKGSKGELTAQMPLVIKIEQDGDTINVTRPDDQKQNRAYHGLVRALLQNMVTGVTEGFVKKLQIIGVGYRAQASGTKVKLQLGFSHDVDVTAPAGITVENDKEDKQILIISGIDKQKVGQFAAQIRALRPPEPYKGKGIRYVDEYVARKAGKAAAK